MKPTFVYPDPSIDASKLAYDLALIYAKAKFEDALRTNLERFSNTLAPRDIEENEFLYDSFMQAYNYYMGREPGELERTYSFPDE